MNHKQWAAIVQNFIKKIELEYPESSDKIRAEWRRQLKKIQETCDDLLNSWAVVEDSIATICQQYPDLLRDEQPTIEEEFSLAESSLREFREGQGYYQLAMYDSAMPLLERLVESEPDFLLGRVFFGLCLYQKERWLAARKQFHWVATFATSNEFIGFSQHMLGCIDLRDSKPQAAKRRFAKAIQLLPEHIDPWFNLAVSEYQLKRYQEAIPVLLKVLSLDGDDWEAMYLLSKCYHHLQQKENVVFWRLSTLEKVSHPQVITAIAQDCEEMGEYQKAIHWYDRLFHQNRKLANVYRGMAWNHWMLREADQAVSWIKKGLSLVPQDPYLLALYFWICLQQGQTQKAKEVLDFLPDQGAKDFLRKFLLSRYYDELGDEQLAMGLAEEMIQQDRESISGLGNYQKGRILLDKGETKQALYCFQRARELVANWKDPIFYEGVCHLLLENPDQTRSCWEQINFYV